MGKFKIKNRQGIATTLVEVIVSAFLMALVLTPLLVSAFIGGRTFADSNAKIVSDLDMQHTINFIQTEFETSIRQFDGNSYNLSTSDKFRLFLKKTYSLQDDNTHWVYYLFDDKNGYIQRNYHYLTAVTKLDVSGHPVDTKLQKLDDTHYFYFDVFTPQMVLLASNHLHGITNTYSFKDAWTIFIVFKKDNKYYTLYATHLNSPFYERLNADGGNAMNSSSYAFKIPVDKEKYGTYNGNTFSGSTDKNNMPWISSYIGSPALIPVKIEVQPISEAFYNVMLKINDNNSEELLPGGEQIIALYGSGSELEVYATKTGDDPNDSDTYQKAFIPKQIGSSLLKYIYFAGDDEYASNIYVVP